MNAIAYNVFCCYYKLKQFSGKTFVNLSFTPIQQYCSLLSFMTKVRDGFAETIVSGHFVSLIVKQLKFMILKVVWTAWTEFEIRCFDNRRENFQLPKSSEASANFTHFDLDGWNFIGKNLTIWRELIPWNKPGLMQ